MEGQMNKVSSLASAALLTLAALAACTSQEQAVTKPAPSGAPAPAAKTEAKPEAAPAKAKATKLAGDVGLLDTEKDYMILVTKEGKLLTLNFDEKTKVTKVTPTPGKISDVGLGSTATVSYQQEKGKNVATVLEYRPAKGE
jgi:glucose/arabinose dehydrogenase